MGHQRPFRATEDSSRSDAHVVHPATGRCGCSRPDRCRRAGSESAHCEERVPDHFVFSQSLLRSRSAGGGSPASLSRSMEAADVCRGRARDLPCDACWPEPQRRFWSPEHLSSSSPILTLRYRHSRPEGVSDWRLSSRCSIAFPHQIGFTGTSAHFRG